MIDNTLNNNDEGNKVEEEDTSSERIITQPFSPSDINLTTPPMNMGDLIEMLDAEWINMKTEYQRSPNLWTETQQCRLIESILLGLRLPAFYFEEINKRQWNIIDGLQRCCAIYNFCITKKLVLNDLEFLGKSFNGKTFNDLNFETRREIKMLPITVNLLKCGVPDLVKYILFKRLNTGGVNLKPQEIRNAVFSGKAIDTIREMANYETFKIATQNIIKTKRQEHLDFVSRFVAFYVNHWEDYEPDLEHFINLSMEYLKDKATDEFIRKLKSDFDHTMYICSEIFGNRAFRKQENRDEPRRPINKAYFEVVSSSFAKLSPKGRERLLTNKELLIDNMNTAMRIDSSYNRSFSDGTGSISAVGKRHSMMKLIIKATLNNRSI